MRKVLPDVDVLRTFPAADDVVSPLYARSVVLVHWCVGLFSESHVGELAAQIQNFDSHFGCSIVFRFRSRERY